MLDIYWEDATDKMNVLPCVIMYYQVSMGFFLDYFFSELNFVVVYYVFL